MTLLSVQYLESSPGDTVESGKAVRGKLRTALDLLPIDYLILGWETPLSLIDICREESDSAGAKLYRWHPLLTGDGEFVPRPEWQTVGLQGDKVPGFRGMPEFTFVCPNKPAVKEAAAEHMADILNTGLFDGIFLDRIRYPSPAANPAKWLACFCPDCQEAASAQGLDLARVQFDLQRACRSPERMVSLLPLLFRRKRTRDAKLAFVDRFLQFRTASVTDFVARTAVQIREHFLEIGLDTFSPTLAYLVGQDLKSLNAHGDWIKPMSYGHTLGPSGLPFELGELADWLVQDLGLSDADSMRWITKSMGHDLPASISALREEGVSSEVLREEVARGRSTGVGCLLAGMELVDMAGVTKLSPQQIPSDLQAYLKGGADGLALSWDLQLMPEEWLALVAAQLEKNNGN